MLVKHRHVATIYHNFWSTGCPVLCYPIAPRGWTGIFWYLLRFMCCDALTSLCVWPFPRIVLCRAFSKTEACSFIEASQVSWLSMGQLDADVTFVWSIFFLLARTFHAEAITPYYFFKKAIKDYFLHRSCRCFPFFALRCHVFLVPSPL